MPDSLFLPRHRDVPAAEGGVSRAKITLLARHHSGSGRMPDSLFKLDGLLFASHPFDLSAQ
jgi:hypothetical protein